VIRTDATRPVGIKFRRAWNSDVDRTGSTYSYTRPERIAGYDSSSIAKLRFNSDTGTNYSFARSDGVAAVTTGTSQDGFRVAQTSITGPRYFIAHVRNVSAQAKVVILEGMSGSESASTAPTINWVRGVWGNSSAQITSVTLNSGAGLLSGTEIWVWGSD
jgi:hypothetical protein